APGGEAPELTVHAVVGGPGYAARRQRVVRQPEAMAVGGLGEAWRQQQRHGEDGDRPGFAETAADQARLGRDDDVQGGVAGEQTQERIRRESVLGAAEDGRRWERYHQQRRERAGEPQDVGSADVRTQL